MEHRKKQIWMPLLFLLIAAVLITGIVLTNRQQTQEKEHRQAVLEKRQELEDARGKCAEDTILLPNTTAVTAEAIAQKIGAEVRLTAQKDFACLYLPEGTSIHDVFADEEIEAFLPEMSPDYYAYVCTEDALGNPLTQTRPNYPVEDEYYSMQDHLDYMNLSDTWAVTKGSGVTVAVIDTGIDTDHPEFAGRISDRSYNASEDKVVRDYGLEVIEDEQGHGTQVAGVLAAGMDGSGVVGIAPEASPMPSSRMWT